MVSKALAPVVAAVVTMTLTPMVAEELVALVSV